MVLVWYDYPAEPNAASALVNDLDLEVAVGSGANTQRLLGNSADGAGGAAQNVSPSTSGGIHLAV